MFSNDGAARTLRRSGNYDGIIAGAAQDLQGPIGRRFVMSDRCPRLEMIRSPIGSAIAGPDIEDNPPMAGQWTVDPLGIRQ
jgi:hypothetical protein